MGYVDLHCHLLWDTDDGPRTPEESLRLCRSLSAHGFTEAAPTPHAWPELPDCAGNDARRAELASLLAREGVALVLHPGAENRLDDELLSRVARKDARPLGAGAWVLVEAPHQLPLPVMPELCFRLQVAGLKVLVAHPERCRAFHDDAALAQRLVDAGCALQLELGSLTGAYGRAAEKLARALLDQGLVAVAASDVHRPDSGERMLAAGLAALHKTVGAAAVTTLLDQNPRRILRGEPLS